MPKVFTSEAQKIGQLGEEIASVYLKNNGFKILDRNYYKFIGEIDIVAEKDSTLHFIEIKSVSCETDLIPTGIRPEENFTRDKQYKFKKIITYYLADKRVSHETNIQVDLICVFINTSTRNARIMPFWEIIL
jgi:putative endonuclease